MPPPYPCTFPRQVVTYDKPMKDPRDDAKRTFALLKNRSLALRGRRTSGMSMIYNWRG